VEPAVLYADFAVFDLNDEGDQDKPVRILLVEDAVPQVRLLREALESTAVPYRMSVAATGDDALKFLSSRGPQGGYPRPDIVLLDLNLPGKDGHKVLREIKSRPDTACIPVIVMSSSRHEADIARAYASHANCYIVKPNGFDLSEFWFRLVRLPEC
jgi:chemotaxis family two-component system response regulator Rcp1